jgi:hypothetical protein
MHSSEPFVRARSRILLSSNSQRMDLMMCSCVPPMLLAIFSNKARFVFGPKSPGTDHQLAGSHPQLRVWQIYLLRRLPCAVVLGSEGLRPTH